MDSNVTTLYVNGTKYTFSMGDHFGQVPYGETLLDTLRERLGLTWRDWPILRPGSWRRYRRRLSSTTHSSAAFAHRGSS